MTTYKGRCHCERVKFEAEGELKQVMACNCSLCSRKGSLLWFVPRDKFRLLTPERETRVYTFNKHFIKHRLEGVDFAALPVKHFDGRSL